MCAYIQAKHDLSCCKNSSNNVGLRHNFMHLCNKTGMKLQQAPLKRD